MKNYTLGKVSNIPEETEPATLIELMQQSAILGMVAARPGISHSEILELGADLQEILDRLSQDFDGNVGFVDPSAN